MPADSAASFGSVISTFNDPMRRNVTEMVGHISDGCRVLLMTPTARRTIDHVDKPATDGPQGPRRGPSQPHHQAAPRSRPSLRTERPDDRSGPDQRHAPHLPGRHPRVRRTALRPVAVRDVNWVRNLRASGTAILAKGAHREEVDAVELEPEAAGTALREALAPYLRSRLTGVVVRHSFHVRADSSIEDYVDLARTHPMFELMTPRAVDEGVAV